MARMEGGMDLSHEMRQWISPSLIEANYILSLSRQELEAAIHQELSSNPALEVSEETTCPLCGGVIEGSFCTTCMISHADDAPGESYDDYPEQLYTQSVTREDSDEFDPMTLVGGNVSLRDQISLDIVTMIDDELVPVAEYLLDSIDEPGFLDCVIDDVAEIFEVDPKMLSWCSVRSRFLLR